MKKTLILLCLFLTVIKNNAQTPDSAQKAKTIDLMIDLACDFKQKFTDPKLKEKQSDEVSTRQTPKIYDEAAFDKQMNLFMKGFVFDKWFDANELQIDFDESLIPNRQFTNQVLSWKKGTTESLKTVVVRSETKIESWESFTICKISPTIKEKIKKWEGELIVDYYTNFTSVSFSKSDIGKTKTFGGINITLKALENGYCRYEYDRKPKVDITVNCLSKNKEILKGANGLSDITMAKILDDLLLNYKYDPKTGCTVSDDVRKKYIQLFDDMDKNKVYAKGTISQIGAIGTIEQVVFYMPTGLKKKTYKVTAYPARK